MVEINIKNLRKNRLLTQRDLACLLGVSRQAVAMWETGQRELKASMLNKLSTVLGVSIDEIIRMQNRAEQNEEVLMPVIKPLPRSASRRKQKKINFVLKAPEAKNVVLTGDFTAWDQNGIQMKRSRNGIWKADLSLNKGRYEYKFIVDDQWWTDPENKNTVTNSYGAINSVMEVAS